MWRIYTEVSRPARRRDEICTTQNPVSIYIFLLKKLNTKHYNHGIVETELINKQSKEKSPPHLAE